MADKNLLSQMLEHLVNDDSAKAEELFHEYVVQASREIYEGLIESELKDEEVEEATDEEDEDQMDEAAEADDEEDDLDENFEAFGDEEGDMGGDATDDLDAELDAGSEEGEEKGEEELFQDLEAIVDELQAKFDELKGIESDEHGDDFGDEEEMPEEGFELETVREYVEKVPAGHGAEKKGGAEGQLSGTGSQSDKPSVNAKSLIDNMKNDMGGTTANILSSKEDAPTFAGAAGGTLKGTGLTKGNVVPNPDAKGNVNVPGGNAGKTGFKHKEPGHGAEKKGGAEGQFSGAGGSAGATDKASLFRGRR